MRYAGLPEKRVIWGNTCGKNYVESELPHSRRMVLGEDYFFFFFAAFFVAKTLTSLRHVCLGELRSTRLDSLYQ